MKKIIIELSDDQYKKMIAHQKKAAEVNAISDTISGFSINLCSCPVSDWLEIDCNGILDLGEVNWKIE
jgi:hypothetical protein